jgi:diguanylate cyclase (GGDEF)-like protein
MLTDFPIQGILDHLVHRIVEVMPVTGAGVSLISASTAPKFVAASDGLSLAYVELQTELEEGPCMVAYQTGDPVAIPDLREERRFASFSTRALAAGLSAVFTFPLRQEDRRLGALDLYRSTAGPLTEEAMVAAQTLADVASAYLVNAQARADLIDSSARAHAIALHDPLTGLPNRILLLERIEHALLSRRRTAKRVAVLFIDLDGFKRVNDGYGHQTGDDLLVAVGTRITGMLRPGDTLARLSGDEFIIVCPEMEEESEVEGIAARLDDAFSTPFNLDGAAVRVSASIGVAFAHPGDSPERVLYNADVGMYQVKRAGGSGHRLVDPEEQALTQDDDSLQRDLSHAIARHELRLEYQPVIRLRDARVVSVEALLRWDHPTRGPISPSLLIPFAEESGDIVEIGEWVLERACIDRHRWEDLTGDEPFMMGVNISAHQMLAPGFAAMVESVLGRTDTDPHRLCLEITESAFVRDARRALEVLSRLKQSGIVVALDDFGTGYSSLQYLMEFPVDILKIDQSFVAKLMEGNASYAIVAKTIELAHLLGLVVVCEGVETTKQYGYVAALTSDYSQGFYFSRPMTADMVSKSARTGTDEAWTIEVAEVQ